MIRIQSGGLTMANSTLDLTGKAALVAGGNGGIGLGMAEELAKYGMPSGEHYAAAKAGVVALVRGLAVEYARHGIRANAILPGWIETDMTASLFAMEKFEKNVIPRIPQRRWGVAADFGPIAVYFASGASAYHSGDAVVIDGGYSCF
jgi:NAD(P)-dependent dehydrogenase (short-subunit alcohol dehydrogenase family)